jgi:hypothetical protein
MTGLEYASIAILCVFQLEFLTCLWTFGLGWLTSAGHVVDVVVVTVSTANGERPVVNTCNIACALCAVRCALCAVSRRAVASLGCHPLTPLLPESP